VRRAAAATATLVVAGAAALLLAASPLRSVQGARAPAAFAAPALLDQAGQGSLVRGRAAAGTVALELDGRPVALAADGRFILGFDRDQGPAARLVARSADRQEATLAIEISPRTWRLEHIDAARRPGGPTEAYLRLRETELARIAAARGRGSDSDGWQQAFVWPSRGRISGVFGSQRVYRGEAASFHSGVDVAPGAGALVVAPADGVVVLAGPPAFSLEGNLVIVDHGMGLNSAFLHLAEVRVREGQRVRQGEPIGTVGATGRATGPHLHWSLKWQDARIDPQLLAGPMSAGR
jgi:murein DD-endopeptidase MepM/ murein hydrolase activator NlpD